MKRLLFIMICAILMALFVFPPDGMAFVSPVHSPIGIPPLEECKIMCVTDYLECYNQCEEKHGAISIPDLIEEEPYVEIESDVICAEEIFHTSIETSNEMPSFINYRKWPLPSSVNPGNTNCTYFTDGTKFCR